MIRVWMVPVLLALLLFCASCSRAVPPQTEVALGTVCTVNAYADGTEAVYRAVFERLHEIDSLFNVHTDSSYIHQINANAGVEAVAVPDSVFFVIQESLRFAEMSGGLFDPTIGPLVSLWGISTDDARVPSDEEIAAVLPLVCWRDVRLDEERRTVFLPRNGMALDLGGIAKGYAADELVAKLREKHVRRALVNLGGNVYVYGRKEGGAPWEIGIRNPIDADGVPLLVFSTTEQAQSVVTSGVYERFFEYEGERYHHILDVTTGRPAQRDCLGVTIISRSSMQADALSTIAFLLDREAFVELVERERLDARYIYIGKDVEVSASSALESAVRPYGSGFSPRIRFF